MTEYTRKNILQFDKIHLLMNTILYLKLVFEF